MILFNQEVFELNINELLIYGRQFLLDTNISEIPLKVRLLAEHVLKLNKFELVVQHEKEVTTPNMKYSIKSLQIPLARV